MVRASRASRRERVVGYTSIALAGACGLALGFPLNTAVSKTTETTPTFEAFAAFSPSFMRANRSCGRRRTCHATERTIRGSRGSHRDAVAGVGGGFGFLAPWPAGKTMVVGGRCGYFYNRRSHRDWGARWGDDRFAIDIGVCGGGDAGTPVLAAHSGIVRVAKADPAYGKEIVIEVGDDLGSVYPDGLATRYSHLGRLTVREGELVLTGQQIGTIGHSGEGGGPRRNAHLHFVAYSGRGPHAGLRPAPMAGVLPCDRCRITSLTQRPDPSRAPFLAALDAKFPMNRQGEVAVKQGSAAAFGFDVRFSQPFQAHRFVLRPRTPDLIARLTNIAGDLTGALVATRTEVGGFRGVLDVPAAVVPGTYLLQWEVIDRDTGRLGNLRPTIVLKVLPASAPSPPDAVTPCPPSTAQSLAPATPSPLSASLDAQFPHDAQGRVHVGRGDNVAIGFNVRFNAPFSTNFVLKPNTIASAAHLLPSFGTPGNVFPGAAAGNDDHVGYYRSSVTVPLCTPSGDYFVQWRVVDRVSGNETSLEPSMVVAVP